MFTASERAASRRRMAETRARLVAARAGRHREIVRAAEKVLLILAERDKCERAAGALLEGLGSMGLTRAEISQWCGGIPLREVSQLRLVARNSRIEDVSGAP